MRGKGGDIGEKFEVQNKQSVLESEGWLFLVPH